jgi:hypothetical protein
MSQSVIGALRVNLGLDSAQFQKGAKGAQQSLATMRKQFLAVSGAAAALGAAIGGFALKAAQDIDKVAKSARRIDATVAGYRALEMAADDAGANISSLADDIQTMNREIAKNSKGAQESLQSLGITAAQLGSLDADQKIALIADRVKALGLDSGQTSVILQQLGVRNREMALLVLGGGDALRRARVDVEEYGLALSDIDAAKIEAANDEIAGLADIGAYLGDQLALKVVPALGNMAMALTDSLREGGLLRGVLDGLLSVVERLGAYVGVIVTGFGVRYVAAMAVAAASTATLSGALLFLRTALIRTGIGALVVGAGELVFQFSKLVTAAGGFGNAMELLGNVAKEVWSRVKLRGESLGRSIKSVAEGIQAAFLKAFAWIVRKFADVTQSIASGINNLFSGIGLDLNLTGMGADAADAINLLATEAENASKMQAAAARTLAAEAAAPLESIAALRAVMADAADDSDAAADAAARLGDALDQVGDSAETTAEDTDAAADAANRFGGALDKVGSSAVRAADKTKELTDAQQALKQSADQVESNFESAFTSFVTGAKSAKQAVGELLSNLGRMAVSAAFKGLFGGSSFFQGLGALIAPSFDGGGYTGSGPRSGGIDGKGGFMAMLHPRETVIDHTRLGGGLAGAAGGAVRIMVEAVEGAMFAPRVRAEAQGVAVQVVQSYDRKLPDRVAGIQSDPRARG